MMTLHATDMYFAIILLKLTVSSRTLMSEGYCLVSGTAVTVVSEVGTYAIWSPLMTMCWFVNFNFLSTGWSYQNARCSMGFLKNKKMWDKGHSYSRVDAGCLKSWVRWWSGVRTANVQTEWTLMKLQNNEGK
jgi:hypothetical protein